MAARQRAATATDGNLAVQPEWRSEVVNRLREYRVRRSGGVISDLQSVLPFEDGSKTASDTDDQASNAEAPAADASPRLRKLRTERFEISIPAQDFGATSGRPGRLNFDRESLESVPELFPVASLPERRRAALLDFALLIFSYGGMLALFTALGGRIGLNRLDLVVCGATLALFYAQYFALFTIFGGSTPGMMIRGLRVVSFDGGVPTSRQMAWRSFGYLVSAGTCLLGFMWALWDEDHLCWQDRISHTYLTSVEEVGSSSPAAKDLGKIGP